MYGVKFAVGPWQLIPPPYVLAIYGPCKTWIAWLVTEPDELAIGFAVALTPPTSAASVAGAIARLVRHSAIG